MSTTLAIAGLVIGAANVLVLWLLGRRKREIRDLNFKNICLQELLDRACAQVEAYHALEDELINRVSLFSRTPSRILKIQFRDTVESQGYTRPTWTGAHARRVSGRIESPEPQYHKPTPNHD